MILLNRDREISLHTHTCFCDGTDTPEEMAAAAFEAGVSVLGFSGHEYSSYDGAFCMSREDTNVYREKIQNLKIRYSGKMKILLGIERDYFGEGDSYPYDYVIGSLHYTKAPDGTLVSVDESEEAMVRSVERYFGGDYRAYAESYYEIIGDLPQKTGADIIGHFDLITKFNEGFRYFDENAGWYRKAALRALAKAAASRPVFEINTGAIARGYRTAPYPAKFLLDEIERLGCPVILTSDCHDRRDLLCGFEQIRTALKTRI